MGWPITIESCSWIDFIPVAYARWYHWICGCTRTQRKAATINQLACPSYSLNVQLLWYPMYYPEGMKARVSPVQWSKPHSILTPTQDSNPGGRIQNHKRWPLHYHCTQTTLLTYKTLTNQQPIHISTIVFQFHISVTFCFYTIFWFESEDRVETECDGNMKDYCRDIYVGCWSQVITCSFHSIWLSDHHLANGLSLSSVHDFGINFLLVPETRLLYQYSVPSSKHTSSKLRSLSIDRLLPISLDCLPGFWFLLFSFYALSNDTQC